MQGEAITPASVVLVKGWTRLSAILYILKHGADAIAKLEDGSHQSDQDSFSECTGDGNMGLRIAKCVRGQEDIKPKFHLWVNTS